MKHYVYIFAAVCLSASAARAGGFASWAANHGIAVEEAEDSDHDGIPALVEYALGLDPTVPDASPAVLIDGKLSFAKNPEAVAAGDVAYAIETSQTTKSGSWSPVVPGTDDATAISCALPAGRGRIFARLVVTLSGTVHPVLEGFAFIPGGNFLMGDERREGLVDGIYRVEEPVHKVYVSDFYMGKHEVTKALWDDVRAWGANIGYTDLPAGGGKAADHPVQSINWYAIVKWCNERSEKEGLSPCYRVGGTVYRAGENDAVTCDWNANGYRLPSEAEWEKAARGGLEGKRFPWGDTISHSQANFWNSAGESYQSGTTGPHPVWSNNDDGNHPYTSPVGSFAPNGYGLYDMAGNIWEWCWDRWDGDYYLTSPATDPRGPATGSGRVFRGGGWGSDAQFSRCANRYGFGPDFGDYNFGFRLARSQP